MDLRAHWEQIYATREADKRSWTELTPTASLALIARCQLSKDSRIVDVGAGASNLVDHLLELGYSQLSIYDIAASALQESRKRLGARADQVQWISFDILNAVSLEPADSNLCFQLWHDRAVFHFLTDAADRAKYLATMNASVKPGGYAIIATFALDGPETCSGLSVQRYDAASLAAELGSGWVLIESRPESHETPWGTTQSFVYGLFKRTDFLQNPMA